MMQLIMPCS